MSPYVAHPHPPHPPPNHHHQHHHYRHRQQCPPRHPSRAVHPLLSMVPSVLALQLPIMPL
eukprot:1530202-Pyramimonas_sp.AAC.1